MLLADGLVMISDTRTNAGIDNIAQFRKLHVFEEPGERVMALASAGNLSVSQAVISLLTEGMRNEETGEEETMLRMPSMFEAARLVGRAIREVRKMDADALEKSGGFNVSMLLGGQLAGRKLRLFMIYAEGNFIECTIDTPFLQIGEHKYGKPILDRAVTYDTDLYDGLKLGLISMDSTMRSNLAVGPPLDVVVIRRDTQYAELNHRIEIGDPYFENLRRQWSEALRAAHREIEPPPYARRSL
jgi:putative proteasome-type protease